MDENSGQGMETMEEEKTQELFTARMQEEKREKLERYRRLNRFAIPGQILFAGSSLMEQFPIGELLADLKLPYTIYNRGIGGYTTQELLDSMDICIYDLLPGTIFLNIGTNDISDPDCSVDRLIEMYEHLLRRIRERLPELIDD